MSYESSIRAINTAQANYFLLCKLGETDDRIGQALETMNRLKAEHKATFGTLLRVEGQYI